MTLPLRIVTQLHIGPAQASVARCVSSRLTLRRTFGARVHVHVHAARLVERCGAIEIPHARMLRLRYGQRSKVSGLLETIDGSPIPGQRIGIAQQAPGWNIEQVGSVITGSTGRFTYVIPAGASRTVTFSYPGTDVLRSTSATTSVSVVGKGTISVAASPWRDARCASADALTAATYRPMGCSSSSGIA